MKRLLSAVAAIGALVGGWALAQHEQQAPQTRTTQQQPQTTKMQMIAQPEMVRYQKGVPPGLPPGGDFAVLSGDPTQATLYTVRLRAPDGYVIKPHYHSKDEHITVIKGHFAMGMGDRIDQKAMTDMVPGGYMSLPAGMHHYAMARGESEVQITGMGPFDIVYINSNDDPRLKRSSR